MLKELLICGVMAFSPLTKENCAFRYDTEMQIGYINLSEKEYENVKSWKVFEENYIPNKNFNIVKIPIEKMREFPIEDRDMLVERYTKNTIEYCWLDHNIVLYSTYVRNY